MKIVAGYQPLMPTFQGQVNEEGVMSLIEFIKSQGRRRGRSPAHAGERRAGPARARGTNP